MSVKYNVVHTGARDYYKVSEALLEKESLGHIITDFYLPNFARRFSNKRFSKIIPKHKTISTGLFIKIIPQKYKHFAFGYIAALITYLQRRDAIVYSIYMDGWCAFSKVFRKNRNDILFQVHPTPWQVRNILDEDQVRFDYLGNFEKEVESLYSPDAYGSYYQSALFFKKVVFASKFTSRGYSGSFDLGDRPILIANYGSKVHNLKANLPPSDDQMLKILTVGQLTQRKGIHHVIQALDGLEDDVEWTIVTHKIDPVIAKILPRNVILKSNLSVEQLASEYQNSDILVLPSIIEGFGLVYVESISLNTPILATTNTAGPELITDGVDGYIIKPGDIDRMKEIILDLLANPDIKRKLRQNLTELGTKNDWSTFKEKIQDFVLNVTY